MPICGAEGAAKGDGAVIQAVGVPAEKSAKQSKQPCRAGGAGEVVNEPAEHGGLLLPAEDANDLGLFKVVHEEAGKNEIGWIGQMEREGVRGNPGDGSAAKPGVARARASFGLTGEHSGVRMQVNTGEDDRKAANSGPATDAAEGVSAAGADVEDAERTVWREDDAPPGSMAMRSGEKAQSRAVGASDPIDLGKGAEATAQEVERGRGVHEFREGMRGYTGGEVEL